MTRGWGEDTGVGGFGFVRRVGDDDSDSTMSLRLLDF